MFLKDLSDEAKDWAPGKHLVVEERNGLIEAVHRVHAAVVDNEGELLYSSGDPDHVTYTRSCIKPIQALPVLKLGAAERFGFSDKEVALISGSHSGEKEHIETVLSIMEKADLDISLLKCSGHVPFDKKTAKEVGEEFTVLHDNCSGKHAGALAVTKHMGWDLASYIEPDHPLTSEIVDEICLLTGLSPEEVHIGSDGCDIPNFAFPVRKMAQLFAMLMVPGDNELTPYLKRTGKALLDHPRMVAGTDRFDTVLMGRFPGLVLSKAGAAGLQSIAFRSKGGWVGIAIKIEDGNYPMIPPISHHILSELGLEDNTTNKYNHPEIKTRAKRVVGGVHVLGTLLHH